MLAMPLYDSQVVGLDRTHIKALGLGSAFLNDASASAAAASGGQAGSALAGMATAVFAHSLHRALVSPNNKALTWVKHATKAKFTARNFIS